jgi:site-specific DNA recombinase
MQRSTEDQIRCCREWAKENGVTVDAKHIYVDEAQTGRSSKRAGLKAIEAALDAGEIDVVVFFATRRLYRKAYKALQFVEEKIVAKRRRAAFVRQAIDTNDEQFWQVAMQFYNMMDERIAAAQAGMVRAGHEGLALKNRVWGTRTFGYTGKPIPGALTKMKKPAREWEIDPNEAGWVVKIFDWFLGRGSAGNAPIMFKAIARRLNHDGALPPPKSK